MGRCEEVLATILKCGELDLAVLKQIDEDILREAIESLQDESIPIDFPNLYRRCAEIALEKVGLSLEDAEIDCNYICARIYVRDKIKAKKLEGMGFAVIY